MRACDDRGWLSNESGAAQAATSLGHAGQRVYWEPYTKTVLTPFAQSILFVLTDGQWRALHAHQSALPR